MLILIKLSLEFSFKSTLKFIPADLLKLFYKIYYNPLVLAPDGSLLSEASTFPVQNTINSFIKSLQFNGEFNLTALTDALQKTEGVVDPVLTSAEAKFGSYQYQPIVDFYVANAGYLKIDTDFPLSNTLTYIPKY